MISLRRPVPWTAALAACAVLTGCLQSEPSAPTDPSTENRSRAVSEQQPPEPESEPESKPADLLPDEVVVEIDWSEAAAERRLPTGDVPGGLAEGLQASPVPVLLPKHEGFLNNAFPVVGQHWYSVAADIEGAHLTLEGNRVARKLDGPVVSEAGKRQVDEGFTLSRTHGIVTLNFRAFGAAYSLDVECQAPKEDPRCTQDGFIIGLVESMGRLPDNETKESGGER